jgi:hypothetical protein
MHKLICNHSLWTRAEVWERVIELYINDEIFSHNVFSYTSKEEDRKKIIRNIVFCQLGGIVEIMTSFQLASAIIVDNMQKFVAKYDLPMTDLEVLLTSVNGKKEKEVQSREVQRGIPSWLQDLENSTTQVRRGAKTLSELLTKDKTS